MTEEVLDREKVADRWEKLAAGADISSDECVRPIHCVSLMLLNSLGCMRIEQHFKLNDDGSGSLSLKCTMRESDLAQGKTLMARNPAVSAQIQAHPLAGAMFNFDEARIRAHLNQVKGVEVNEVRSRSNDGVKTVFIQITFDNLDALVQTSLMKGTGVKVVRDDNEQCMLQLYTQGQPVPVDPRMKSMQEVVMRSYAVRLAGLRFQTVIETPTDILDANADEVRERLAVWNYDMDKDPRMLDKFAAGFNMTVKFDGAHVNLAPMDHAPRR